MPPVAQDRMVLRFYCDLSVEQTAAILAVPPGTVKSKTTRGLAALRRTLDDPDSGNR